MTEEKELIGLVKSGNTEAFGEIVEIYADMVYSLCIKLTNNIDWTDELSQKVFIKAFKSIKRFQGNSSIKTWLYKITMNQFYDDLRKKKRIKYSSLDLLNNRETLDVSEQDNELFRLSLLLDKYLEYLPPKLYFIATLRIKENMTYKEISEVLNCSVATVGTRYSRAVLKLKKIIVENEGTDEL